MRLEQAHHLSVTKRSTAAILLCLTLAFMPGVAAATASSALTYITATTRDGAVLAICGKATIADVADNKGHTYGRQWSNNTCSGAPISASTGSLGVKANGYRNGVYCGTTGWYYNGVATSTFAVGSVICSNPAGIQTFRTTSHHAVWSDPSSQYFTGSVTSPNQGY